MGPDQFLDLGDRTLRVRRLTPRKSDGLERTTVVFLHEGLGCIDRNRDGRRCDQGGGIAGSQGNNRGSANKRAARSANRNTG
jgi:hypothetical protein